jgi:hypothetical protein
MVFHMGEKDEAGGKAKAEKALELVDGRRHAAAAEKKGVVATRVDMLFYNGPGRFICPGHGAAGSGGFGMGIGEEGQERVHRSFIVAIRRIESYSAGMIEIGGVTIPIGKGYRDEMDKL